MHSEWMLWLVALWALVAVAAVVETLLFDLVALMRAGAYGFVMASNSNSRPPPAEVLVRGTGFGLIRERQELCDLVRGERDPAV